MAKCKSCKNKVTTELPPVIDENIYIPTMDDIKLAYLELGSKDITPHKEMINKIYNFLFNQDFDFSCSSCSNKQSRRLKTYIDKNL